MTKEDAAKEWVIKTHDDCIVDRIIPGYTEYKFHADNEQSFIAGADWVASQQKGCSRWVNIVNELIPLAEDGHLLHLKNACHQEFLDEDLATIGLAKKLLDESSPCSCDQLREALEENPYPEKVFPPLSKDDLKYIDKLLEKDCGFRLDRLSAHIGRELLTGIRNKLSAIIQTKTQ